MSQFLSPLIVEELGEDKWRLMAPLRYQSDLLGRMVMVREGFQTDLESVPRWLPVAYSILYGSAHAAAVVHDWLYTVGEPARRMCDSVLYEAIITTGQPAWKAWLIWAGVRLGGGLAWEQHRRAEAG